MGADPLATKHLLPRLRHHALESSRAVVATQVIKVSVQLLALIALARLLSPADFGLVAMVTIITGLVGIVKDGGLSAATVQNSSITQRQVSNLFWLNVAFGFVLAGLVACLGPLLAVVYADSRLITLTVAMSAAFALGGLGIQHEAILKRQMRFAALAWVDTIALSTGSAAAILSAYQGAGYWSLVIGPVLTSATQASLLWICSSWRPSKFSRTAGTVKLLKFGLNLAAANFIGYLSSNLTPFLVGTVGGAQQLGLFNRAAILVALPSSHLLAPLLSVAQSAFARLSQETPNFRAASTSLIKTVSVCSTAITVCVFTQADQIVLTLLGSQWLQASQMLRLLSLFALVEPLASCVATLLIAHGRTADLLVTKVVSLFLVTASGLCGMYWGAIGVIAAFAMSGVFIRTPIFIWLASRSLPISQRDFYASALPPLAIGAGTVGVITVARILAPSFGLVLDLILWTLTTLVVYGVVCLIVPTTRYTINEFFSAVVQSNKAKVPA